MLPASTPPLPPALAELAERLRPHALGGVRGAIATGVPALDALLPDGGLPRGAVTELTAVACLGLSTRLALAACASAQRASRARGGRSAWCGWLDVSSSLYAPGALAAGVDLERLVVARPPAASVARVALRMAESHAFSTLVVETGGLVGAPEAADLRRLGNVVRRLALAVEKGDTAVLVLTDRAAARPLPLPVALRVELRRGERDALEVRVAKERRGRVTAPRRLELAQSA